MLFSSVIHALYVIFFSLTLLLILAIAEIFFWRPRRIKKAFIQKLGMNNYAVHIGKNLALAVDFTHRQIALYRWGKIRTFPYDIIVDGNYECDRITDENQNIQLKNHRVVILTNDYQHPEISIKFWTNTQAQQCMISLRQLEQYHENSPKAEHAQETTPATAEPVVHTASPTATTPPHPPQTDAKTSDVDDEGLVQLLTCYLKENGFSRADGNKKVRQKRFIEAVKLLEQNYTLITGAKRIRNWQKNLASALEPFFMSGPNDSKGFGYTKSSMSANVSKYTVLKTEK